jgi:2-iminobutanoate/2-iminopropanoate deaminase
MSIQRINVDNCPRLPVFSHAVIAGDFIFISGTLGLRPGTFELADGGIGPQTVQCLRHVETILKACDATLADLVRINVFLADESEFAEMNEAYASVIGSEPPTRITVGRAGLQFGAAIEIDCTAYRPRK